MRRKRGPIVLLFLGLNWLGQLAFAQVLVTGEVRDAISQQALGFATIVYDPARRQGTTTDLQGRFSLLLPAHQPKLVVSFLGYQRLTLDPDSLDLSQPLNIFLQPQEVALEEVLIAAAQNPALRLIEAAISQRKINDPERIENYQCRIYNKLFFDWLLNRSAFTDQAESQRLDSLFQQTGLSVMESVSERRHEAPDRTEEEVLATQVAGFQNPSFASLATDFQPFSFYEAQIPLLDKFYRNPISPGSVRHYEFRLEDQWMQGSDTVFLILFSPKTGSNQDLLRGQLFLSSRQYAIQQVIAEPAKQGLLHFRIEQQYQWLPQGHWFPAQLNFRIQAPQYPSKQIGLEILGHSLLSDISLETVEDQARIGREKVFLHPEAAQRTDPFWQANRVDSLSLREQRTYAWVDSLGQEKKFDRKLGQIEKLIQGRWGFRYLDWEWQQAWLMNEYEGNRLGLHLWTNGDVSKRFSLGGFAAYGLRDQAWKYGGSLQLDLLPKQDWAMEATLQQNLTEVGRSLLAEPTTAFDLRSYLLNQWDSIGGGSLHTQFRLGKSWQSSLSWEQWQRQPTYAYDFQPENAAPWRGHFQQREWRVGLRFAFREEVLESMGQSISQGSRYPVLRVAYAGSDPRLGSSYAYQKVEVELSQRIRSRQLGQSDLRLRAGQNWGEALPAGLLFNGGGSYGPGQWLIAPGYFQTMHPNEFLSDQYVQAFFTHDFGGRLLRIKSWQPRIKWVQGFVWGKLSQPEAHQGISFQTLEQGYHESGLILDQLLSIRYLNLLYLGLGAGVFARYGPYQLPDWQQNLAFKLSLTLSP